MERQIRARLGAARIVLEQVAGTATHAAVSQVQAAAVCEVLMSQPTSAELRAGLCSTVVEMKWHGDDAARVLGALSEKGPLPATKRRRTAQHYAPAVLSYGRQEDQELLASSSGSSDMKLERILQLCVGIGLRCPSEGTLKLLASWWMVATHGNEVENLEMKHKLALFQHVKKAFDQMRRRLSCSVWLLVGSAHERWSASIASTSQVHSGGHPCCRCNPKVR